MNEIRAYVERAFARVPDSLQKSDLMQEIIGQLEENVSLFEENGKSREDAVNKAIVEFGDLNEILAEMQIPQTAETEKIANGKAALSFSVIGSLAITALMIFINLNYTPGNIWFVYPVFGVLWWPLGIYFFGKWRKQK